MMYWKSTDTTVYRLLTIDYRRLRIQELSGNHVPVALQYFPLMIISGGFYHVYGLNYLQSFLLGDSAGQFWHFSSPQLILPA